MKNTYFLTLVRPRFVLGAAFTLTIISVGVMISTEPIVSISVSLGPLSLFIDFRKSSHAR